MIFHASLSYISRDLSYLSWSFISNTPPLHRPYTAPTPPLHRPYTAHTPPIYRSYTAHTLLIHRSYTAPTPPIHCSSISILPLRWSVSIVISLSCLSLSSFCYGLCHGLCRSCHLYVVSLSWSLSLSHLASLQDPNQSKSSVPRKQVRLIRLPLVVISLNRRSRESRSDSLDFLW